MTKIIMSGCHGRMGTVVCRLAAENPATEIVAGIDSIEKSENLPFPVYKTIKDCTEQADAIICFERPTAEAEIFDVFDKTASERIPLVFCTTGLSAAANAAIEKAAESAAILRSANMSLGINLLSNILNRVSKILHDSNFDIEIIEKHHNQKLDAPSGTAILLANSINDALSGEMNFVNDRSKSQAKRERNEIGISAIRGGTIVGEHSAIFAGRDEVLEFTHIAQSREVFAVGAIKAAEFLKGKPAGMYSMQDLINNPC
jgi:4-hydroxy-tetrahydrodipicolinate reductase